MTACGCRGPRAADYLGWTAGDRSDAEEMAAEFVTTYGCEVEIMRCTAYGYDVVRRAS